MLNVHILLHTHTDGGWMKSFDEYYSGANVDAIRAAAKPILDSVVDELDKDFTRKFTFVDMKFFYTWYKNLNQGMKEKVKKVIQNGQLEITQGGWVSTDEACTNYQDMILNMYIGHQFLQREFGVKPHVGWMVDAFGHSQANAALFSDFGFDAFFMAREPADAHRARLKDGELAFVWKPFEKHFGTQKEIFTHYFVGHYVSPEGTLNDIERTSDDQF